MLEIQNDMIVTYLWSHMTAVSAREGEISEQALHSILVLGSVVISFTPDTLEVEIGDETRSAVSRTRDDESVEIILLDHAVEVDVATSVSVVHRDF